MASLRFYKCCNCNYNIATDPRGFYSIMSGMLYEFKCSKCKAIVHIHSTEFGKYGACCPRCGNQEYLSTWNPIEGKCPKCGGTMKTDNSMETLQVD